MSIPTLKMEGRSGCNLVIEYQDDHTVIKKYSSSAKYNQRLIKQAEKQKNFFQLKHNSAFQTPEILEVDGHNGELAWFKMNYVFADKYSDYLDQISVRQVKKLLNNLIEYFDDAIAKALKEVVNKDVFLHKFNEIRSNIRQNAIIDTDYFYQVMDDLVRRIPVTPLPLGTCHGDFTFSNILFGDGEIFLVDFLDSFIESPVIDIVKMRQDTCFKWSIMLEQDMPKYKVNKLYQILDYFDHELQLYCRRLDLEEWYTFLQAVNLLRIVPYLNKPTELLFIENSLKKLLK